MLIPLNLENWGIYGKDTPSSDYEMLECDRPFTPGSTHQISVWLNHYQQSESPEWGILWPEQKSLLMAYFIQENVLDQSGRPISRVLLHQFSTEQIRPVQAIPLLEQLLNIKSLRPLTAFSFPNEEMEQVQHKLNDQLKEVVLQNWLCSHQPLCLRLSEAKEVLQEFENWWPEWMLLSAVPETGNSLKGRGLILSPFTQLQESTIPRFKNMARLNRTSLENLLTLNLKPDLNQQILSFTLTEEVGGILDKESIAWIQKQPDIYHKLINNIQKNSPFDPELWLSALNSDDLAIWHLFLHDPETLDSEQEKRLIVLLESYPSSELNQHLQPSSWIWLSLKRLHKSSSFLEEQYPWLAPFLENSVAPILLPPVHWENWANPVLTKLFATESPLTRIQPPLTLEALQWLTEHLPSSFKCSFTEILEALQKKIPLPESELEKFGSLLTKQDFLCQWTLHLPKALSALWFQHSTALSQAEKQWLSQHSEGILEINCPQWSEPELGALYPALSRWQILQLITHYAQQPEGNFRSRILYVLLNHFRLTANERQWLYQRFLSLESIPELSLFSISERLCLWPFVDLERDILRPLFQADQPSEKNASWWPHLLYLLRKQSTQPPPSPSAKACEIHPHLLLALRTLPGWHAFGLHQNDKTELEMAMTQFLQNNQIERPRQSPDQEAKP